MERSRARGIDPDLLVSLPCDLVLLVWGVYALTKPGGPQGEQLTMVYYSLVPMLMIGPGWVAIHSWLDRWALSKAQMFIRNVPFALVVLLWGWLALSPT